MLHLEQRAHGVVVSHPLSMREALGLIPSVATACLKAARNDRVGQNVRCEFVCNNKTVAYACARTTQKCPATRNRTRDHLIAAKFYSQMLYQLSYSRLIFWNLSWQGRAEQLTSVCLQCSAPMPLLGAQTIAAPTPHGDKETKRP